MSGISLLETLSGFLLVLAGSALFSHSAETLTRRLFTNHSLGRRILGNLSLSIPELVLPVVSFLGGSAPGRKEAGIGAILGAPLFLVAILWPVTLWVTRHEPAPKEEKKQLGKEAPLLAGGLFLALAAGLTPSRPVHFIVAAFLLLLYPAILLKLRTEDAPEEEGPEEGSSTVRQTLAFLAGAAFLFIGPVLLLKGILHSGESQGNGSIFLLSLLLSSLSTESPEALSLVMLLKKRQTASAYGVLWGSIHFQLTVSVASGLLLSPWTIEGRHLIAGGILIVALLFSTWWALIPDNGRSPSP